MSVLSHGQEFPSYYDPAHIGKNPFRDVLKLLCKKAPPKFIKGYGEKNLTEDQHLALQDWASSNCGLFWLTGYGIIEAARHLVETAVENANIPPEEYWTGIPKEEPPPKPVTTLNGFQQLIGNWCALAFGDTCASNPQERGLRLLEEAIELGQSLEITKEQAHLLVDYVYGRPVGEVRQEISGVLITLFALTTAVGANAQDCIAEEYERISQPEFLEKIRAKHNSKVDAGVSLFISESDDES